MKHRISRFSRMAAGQEGIALITVMIIAMIATILGAAMIANVLSQQNGIARERRITTARAAADAGVDRLVFELKQGTAWEDMPTSYSTASGAWWGDPSTGGWWKIGNGGFRAHVDVGAEPELRTLTLEGQYPFGTGPVRKIQATVKRQAPEALGYAMFADHGIDIHHHGSSYVTPTVQTTQVHSNGYINLDYTSSFRVDAIEAVTTIEISKGGSNPGGSGPYNWAYWIPGTDTLNSKRCYPPKVFPAPTTSSADPAFSTYWNTPTGTSCAGSPLYSPNAQVIGDMYAYNVHMDSKGDTVQSISGTTCGGTSQPGRNDPVTGACIPDRLGDVHAHQIVMPGQTITGPGTGGGLQTHYRSGFTPAPCSGAGCLADCPTCNQGTGDTGGHVGGSIFAHDTGWSVPSIPFPSLDYASVYLPLAKTDQGGAATCASTVKTCHVFPTSDGKDFLTYMSNSAIVTPNYATSSCQTCVFWLDANKQDTTVKANVRYVVLRGNYYLNSGITFSDSTMRSKFTTPAGNAAPEVMVTGSVISPTNDITVEGSLTIVGRTMDPFQPRAQYPANTVPGILAAGGKIEAHDADDDGNWDSAGQYEPLKRNRLILRGLAYAATWSAAQQTSISDNMHWHNYDPKNQTTIIGAQVGGTLHDCNSFEFSYDPLVMNLPGFGTTAGTNGVFVVDWQEL